MLIMDYARPFGPYGFDSILHYSKNAFSLRGEDGKRLQTIFPRPGYEQRTIGGVQINQSDLGNVARLYRERPRPQQTTAEVRESLKTFAGRVERVDDAVHGWVCWEKYTKATAVAIYPGDRSQGGKRRLPEF